MDKSRDNTYKYINVINLSCSDLEFTSLVKRSQNINKPLSLVYNNVSTIQQRY